MRFETEFVMPRRAFLRGLCSASLLALLPVSVFGAAPSQTPAPKKALIVYFSRSGNTQKIAEDIKKLTGADIVRIETVKPYPDDYQQCVEQAKAEQKANARPAIKTKIDNLNDYGVVFLGYPNWWSSMPMPVYSFIEQNKLNGKTIAPFMTHGGGGLGHSMDDLRKLAPHSKILKPLAVNGQKADSALKDVEKWLEGLGPALIETTTGNTQIYPDGAY